MNICCIEGCARAVIARKLCTKHYQHFKARGELESFAYGRAGTTLVPVTHPIYKVWSSMKTRCTNEGRADFARYGGAGVIYDPAWQHFNNFCADMFEGYAQGLWRDRKDNSKGYSKDNCRWVTPTESNRNRSNVRITPQRAELIRNSYASGVHTQEDLAEVFDVDQTTISDIVTGRSWA